MTLVGSLSFVYVFQSVNASTDDLTMRINVYHHDGEVKICIEIEGHEKECTDNLHMDKYQNPFEYKFEIEEPDKGDDMMVCYELKDTDQVGCETYQLQGRSIETMDLILPGAK